MVSVYPDHRSAPSPWWDGTAAAMSASSAASTPRSIRLWCQATTATGSGKRQFRAAGFTPTCCRRTDRRGPSDSLASPRAGRGRRRNVSLHSNLLRLFGYNRIVDGNRAAGDHLGIDPAFVVAEVTHQCMRDGEAARRGFRVDVGGGAADDPLHHFQPDRANAERPVEQLGLMPCRPAADIEVGAESQGVNRLANHILDGGDAAEIDDRDDLAGDIRKTVSIA